MRLSRYGISVGPQVDHFNLKLKPFNSKKVSSNIYLIISFHPFSLFSSFSIYLVSIRYCTFWMVLVFLSVFWKVISTLLSVYSFPSCYLHLIYQFKSSFLFYDYKSCWICLTILGVLSFLKFLFPKLSVSSRVMFSTCISWSFPSVLLTLFIVLVTLGWSPVCTVFD